MEWVMGRNLGSENSGGFDVVSRVGSGTDSFSLINYLDSPQ